MITASLQEFKSHLINTIVSGATGLSLPATILTIQPSLHNYRPSLTSQPRIAWHPASTNGPYRTSSSGESQPSKQRLPGRVIKWSVIQSLEPTSLVDERTDSCMRMKTEFVEFQFEPNWMSTLLYTASIRFQATKQSQSSRYVCV